MYEKIRFSYKILMISQVVPELDHFKTLLERMINLYYVSLNIPWSLMDDSNWIGNEFELLGLIVIILYFYAENVQFQVTLFVFVLTEFLQVFMQKISSWKCHCLCWFNWFFLQVFMQKICDWNWHCLCLLQMNFYKFLCRKFGVEIDTVRVFFKWVFTCFMWKIMQKICFSNWDCLC